MKNLIVLCGENNGDTIIINDPCRNIVSILSDDKVRGCMIYTLDGRSHAVQETATHICNLIELIRRGLRGEA